MDGENFSFGADKRDNSSFAGESSVTSGKIAFSNTTHQFEKRIER